MGVAVDRVTVLRRFGRWAFTAEGDGFVRAGALLVSEVAPEREALDAARKMFPDAAPTAIVRGLDQQSWDEDNRSRLVR